MNIEQRLAKLEATNRYLKMILAIAAVSAAVLLVIDHGTLTSGVQAQDQTKGRKSPPLADNSALPKDTWTSSRDEVSKNLEFKDATGVVRMRIGLDEKGDPYIQMRNSKEDQQAILNSYRMSFFLTGAGGKPNFDSTFRANITAFSEKDGAHVRLYPITGSGVESWYLELKDVAGKTATLKP